MQEDTVKLATKGTAKRGARLGIRRGQKDAKGQQSLESPTSLTLGSMFLARFSTTLQRKVDLTNAFKSFFGDNSFKLCSKIAGILGKQGAKGRKVWNLPRPLPEPFLRASSKGLAQGQVALTDSTRLYF